MDRCPATTFDARSGKMVSCSYEPIHDSAVPHETAVDGRTVTWTGDAAQPMGIIHEMVHYVRAVMLPDGTYDEVPAIVCATYRDGAALHTFVDPHTEYQAMPVEHRTSYDASGAPNTWHTRQDCRK
jgi:hypothetical protein